MIFLGQQYQLITGNRLLERKGKMMNTTLKNIFVGVLGLGIGLSLGGILRVQAAPQNMKIPQVLRAQRFELVGADGKIQAELGTSPSGVPRLSMNGNQSGATGGPFIELEDNDKRKIIIGGGGNYWLQFTNTDGTQFFNLRESTWGDRKPILSLRDRNGEFTEIKSSGYLTFPPEVSSKPR